MNNRADPMLADPLKTPLQDLDVSDPRRFRAGLLATIVQAITRRVAGALSSRKPGWSLLVDYPV